MPLPFRHRRLRRLCRCSRGIAALEFAMVAPVAILFILGIVEIGRWLYIASDVQNGAERIARYAFLNIGGEDILDVTGRANSLAALEAEMRLPASGQPYFTAIRALDVAIDASSTFEVNSLNNCDNIADASDAQLTLALRWRFDSVVGSLLPWSAEHVTTTHAAIQCHPSETPS